MISPASPTAPRDILPEIRAHRGMMVYNPEQQSFAKYALTLGEPNEKGFIPLQKPVGIMANGVIFLKAEGSVEQGYYAITSRDLYRRRIDARPTRKLSLQQAYGILGAPVPESAVPVSGAGGDAGSVEAGDADLAFEQQVQSLLHHTNPEEDFL